MAYKILQPDENGVLREVVIRGSSVWGSDLPPTDVELKEFDDKNRSFVSIATMGTPDRLADVVDINGWELGNYLKNPVGMWAHNYRELPIFKSTDIEIKPKAKKMSFKANFDDHEFALKVYNSFRKEFMRGFSVGFIPLDMEKRNVEEMSEDEKKKAGWFGGNYFKRQELLEISAAPIPAHPDALAGYKSMGLPTIDSLTAYEQGWPKTKQLMANNDIWIPINDPSLFYDVKPLALGENVEAIVGKQIGSESLSVIGTVVGYLFPANTSDEKILEWFNSKGISEGEVKIYMERMKSLTTEPIELDFGDLVERGICGSGSLPTSDKSSWDGAAAERRMWEKGVATYKKGHVWQRGGADPQNKTSYSLPFADIINGTLSAIKGGVVAAMKAAHGARNNPQGNRKAMHNFLARYYKKFGLEVPEFKEYSDEEIEKVFGPTIEAVEEEVEKQESSASSNSSDVEAEEESKDMKEILFEITETLKALKDVPIILQQLKQAVEELKTKEQPKQQEEIVTQEDLNSIVMELTANESEVEFSEEDMENLRGSLGELLKDNLLSKVEDEIEDVLKQLTGDL